jgi:hypothetical protein
VVTPTFTQTATLSDWAVNKQNINLNAGENTIEFKATATGASSIYFDNIVVVPTVYGYGIIIQENETGFVDVNGTIDNTYSGYTGTGYANTNDSNGAGIDWHVYFGSSVTKSFAFRYACPDNRTADLIVNGEVVATEINFPSTGAWTTWDFVTVYANTDAGDFDVRLQSTSDAGLPNIDYIEVTGGMTTCQQVQNFGYRLDADLDGDCLIDLSDLGLLVEQWLSTSPQAVPPNYSPDLVVDDHIDFADFAVMAEQWLICNDPENSGCIANW